jgi:hypothetical protein
VSQSKQPTLNKQSTPMTSYQTIMKMDDKYMDSLKNMVRNLSADQCAKLTKFEDEPEGVSESEHEHYLWAFMEVNMICIMNKKYAKKYPHRVDMIEELIMKAYVEQEPMMCDEEVVKEVNDTEEYEYETTIVSGVVCNKCQSTLPDHTMAQHLDVDFMENLHNCEKPKSQCASIIFHNPETENYIWYYHREDKVIKEMGMNENTSNYIINLPIDYDVEHEKSINQMNGYIVFSQTE